MFPNRYQVGRATVWILPTGRFKAGLLSVSSVMSITPENACLAPLLLSVLRRGTRKYPTLADVNRRLDYLWGTCFSLRNHYRGNSLVLGLSAELLDGRFLPDGGDGLTDGVLDLIHEILFRPLLDKDGLLLSKYVESEKELQCDAIRAVKNNPRVYAAERARALLYEGQPCGIPLYGTEEQTMAVTREQLTDYWRCWIDSLHPDCFYVGPMDARLLLEKLTHTFGAELGAPEDAFGANETLNLTDGFSATGDRHSVPEPDEESEAAQPVFPYPSEPVHGENTNGQNKTAAGAGIMIGCMPTSKDDVTSESVPTTESGTITESVPTTEGRTITESVQTAGHGTVAASIPITGGEATAEPIPTAGNEAVIGSVDRAVSEEAVRRVSETTAASQSQLVIGLRCGIRLGDPEFYACAVMNELLGGSPISRLFTYVREKQSLCYSCSSSYAALSGTVTVSCGLSAANRELAETEIFRQLNAIRLGDFTLGELDAARKSLIHAYRQLEDSPAELENYYYGRALAGCGVSLQACREGFAAVTAEEVAQAAGKLQTAVVYFFEGTQGDCGGEEDEDKDEETDI